MLMGSLIHPWSVTKSSDKDCVRALILSLSILAILLLYSPGSSRGAGPTTHLKVGYLSIAAGHSVLWVTKEAGLFAKNGLNVETIYAPSSALTQAMLAGNIPIGITGPVSPLEANLKGADFVILGTLRKLAHSCLFGKPQKNYQRPTTPWQKAGCRPLRQRHR